MADPTSFSVKVMGLTLHRMRDLPQGAVALLAKRIAFVRHRHRPGQSKPSRRSRHKGSGTHPLACGFVMSRCCGRQTRREADTLSWMNSASDSSMSLNSRAAGCPTRPTSLGQARTGRTSNMPVSPPLAAGRPTRGSARVCGGLRGSAGFWQARIDQGTAAGFDTVRLTADAAWWGSQLPAGDALIRYESELNRLAGKGPQSILCAYDLSHASGSFVLDILKVHPRVFLGVLEMPNPYYLTPDEFLAMRTTPGATVSRENA